MTETFYNNIAALQEQSLEQGYKNTSALQEQNLEQHYKNTAALQEHDQANTPRNAADLPTWVMDGLALHAGHHVLDIGSGSGQQALFLAQRVGHTGHVLAMDRSYEALSMLAQRSQEMGLETRLRLLQVPLDELSGHLRRDDFDRVLGSRALYHIKQPRSVFTAIYQALKPGGMLFFYGPARNNNAEIKRFHTALRGEASLPESKELVFIEEVGLPCARDLFSQTEVTRFEQSLLFDSPDALYTCWSTSALYEEELDAPFRKAAIRHFEYHAVFETVKRVVGVKAIK